MRPSATMPMFWKTIVVFVAAFAMGSAVCFAGPDDLVRIDNGTASIGIEPKMGGAISWLSWREHPKNVINIHDPGRLIQQSYYSGQSVERRADGQHARWSPWTWNPIQAGGVDSWARVTEIDKKPTLIFAETIPKLWDMPNEEAAAVMRQWTGFEPGMPNVIVVRCDFESRRRLGDRWGDKAVPRHQELPACYFTRSFGTVKSYLGNGTWRDETLLPGPPWGKVIPPRKTIACFDAVGQGIAVFSPVTTGEWNVGPAGEGDASDPKASPCMHVAPLETIRLGPKSRLQFRFWLIVGTEAEIVPRLDALGTRYGNEQITLTTLP